MGLRELVERGWKVMARAVWSGEERFGTAVELVMEIEEAFNITLHDKDAESIRTVGELHSFVWRRIQHRTRRGGIPGRGLNEAKCWNRIQTMVCRILAVERSEVTQEARFIADLGAD